MTHGGNVWQGKGPESWLDFSANVRADGAPDWVKSAIGDAMTSIGYYPDGKMTAARGGLSAALGLPADCVLPTPGGMAAIEMACPKEKGDVLIFDPAFTEYERVSRRNGHSIRRASLLSAKCMYGSLLGASEELFTRGMTVWLNNPNNPIGCGFDRAEVISLLKWVEHMRGRLIVDEAFISFSPELSVVDLVREHPALIVVGSLTKSLGIPGVRLGYLCAHPSVLMRLEAEASPWQLNCFAANIAAGYHRHLNQLVEDALVNARRRAALAKGLKNLGLFVYPSRTNYLLAAFGRPVAPVARALRGKGILVRQCQDFQGIDDGYHMRVAVKRTADNMRLLEALEEIV